MSTMMEQDFTVEGKKGDLGCPFQQKEPTAAQMGYAKVGSEKGYVDHSGPGQISDPTPHKSADPICAAMYTEVAMHQPNGSGGIPAPPSVSGPPKCPIRYLDQHSPEEIAHYVSTHKHELPRSHAICLRRYQRNEEQIRKLDAKYGSLVGMIEGLSQLHRPMLPSDQGADAGAEGEGESPRPRPVLPVMDALAKQQQEETDADHRASTEQRVDKWAQEVSASVTVDGAFSALDHEDLQVLQGQQRQDQELDDERQSHFDRMLKEVRLGESPSRPWGISVPVRDPVDGDHGVDERPESPPPAPVRMSGLELSGSPPGLGSPQALPNGVGKGVKVGQPDMPQTETPRRPAAAKCPFDHTRFTGILNGHSPHSHPPAPQVKDESEDEDGTAQDFGNASSRRTERVATEPPFTPASKQSRGHSNGQGRGAREATGNFVPPSLSASPASRASRSFRPAFLGLPLDEQAGSNAGAAGLAGDAASVRSGPAPAEATRSVGNVARDVAGPHQRRPQPQPQMLFTGPVFIGYPVEQAIQIMQALQRGSSEG